MFLKVNKIKGKKYLYANEYLYISRGVKKLKSKLVGRADGPLEKRVKRIEDFYEEVAQEEIAQRLKYWFPKIKNRKGFLFDLKKLENLRSLLYRGKEQLSDSSKQMIEAAFQVDFIYNSNKIEGSKVPRETVEQIVRQGGKSNEEVLNSLRAMEYTKGKGKITSIPRLVKLHKILLAHEPSIYGLRKQPILVFNSPTLPFEEIPSSLEALLEWLSKNNHKMYPPELAFDFYYQFERIHPFKDGNGRIGRLLMNSILKEHRYHPIIIWNSNRRAHMNAFEKAMEGGHHKYLKFMAEQMIKTYDVYLKKIKKAREIEQSIKHTFFEPSYE